jgi:hypothetical protein
LWLCMRYALWGLCARLWVYFVLAMSVTDVSSLSLSSMHLLSNLLS